MLQVDLATLEESSDASLEELGVGVLSRDLLLERDGVLLEALDDGLVVLGGENETDGFSLGDLDFVEEDIVVVVAEGERRDGHDLRDRAEGEDGGISQILQVVEAVERVLHGISDELVEALKGLGLVLVESQILHVGGVLGPDSLGPEETRGDLADVLQVVTNDVGLLQEQTHRVGERFEFLGSVTRVLDTGSSPEGRESVADESSDVVAVELPVLNRVDFAIQKLGHTGSHATADVDNDVLVSGLESSEGGDELVVLLQKIDLVRLVSVLRGLRADRMRLEAWNGTGKSEDPKFRRFRASFKTSLVGNEHQR